MLKALLAKPSPVCGGSPLVLMVSGGSDSTAMLVRCVRGEVDLCDGAGPRRLEPADLCVLHVNHCLRGAEADRDEAFVADLCGRLGVAFRSRRIDVPALVAQGANFEDAARGARYEAAWELAGELAAGRGLLAEQARILVAHTADDRAETFLMRAMTGSGLTGLAGMRRTRGIVVRPLLDETRESLRDYLRLRGIGWCEDSTNDEDDALRSYVRHRVTPPMRERCASFAHVLGRSLDVMGQEDDYLEGLALDVLCRARRPSRDGVAVLDATVLGEADPVLARRALLRAFSDLLGPRSGEVRVEQSHVVALLDLVSSGRGSCSLAGAVDARMEGGCLVLILGDAPRPPEDVELPVPGEVDWGGAHLSAALVEVPAGEDAATFAREQVRLLGEDGRRVAFVDAACFDRLWVGSPRTGERMRPFGMKGSKLLSDLLAQAGVPARDRPWTPVVRCGKAGPDGCPCVWVGGIRLDAQAACTAQTTCLIQLKLDYFDCRGKFPPAV